MVGATSREYRNLLPPHIERRNFKWPSVRGNKIRAMWQLFFAARRLKKLVQKERATQVFANTPRTIFVAYLAKRFFRMPAKFIMMVHDFTIPVGLLRRILQTADIIVVNSIPTRKYVLTQLPKNQSKKLRIVENGVDFGRVPDTQPVTQVKNVLLIGRVDPRKGQKYAVQAAVKLPELQFRIVGSPFPGDLRTMDYDCEIREIVHEHHLQNVTFVSEVLDPFLEIMKADIVLVLPTEPETFGRVVTEALACGRPVIAFDRTGPGDILRQFEAAERLPSLRAIPDNTDSVVERLSYFLHHPADLKKIASVARRFVKRHYPLTETVKRLVFVLSE